MVSLMVAVGLLWSAASFAAELTADKQAEMLEKIKKLEQQINELTALKLQKQSIPVKQEQCMKVVGVEKYCSCVVEKLPASVDYRQFVNLLLTPADQFGYDRMEQEQKNDIDLALVAWAKCVDYKGPKGSGFIDGILKRDTLF